MINEDKAWVSYKENFHETYDELNYTGSLQAYVMRAGHKFSERQLGGNLSFESVLEVGAGTGEHFSFVRHKFNEYTFSDFNEKALDASKAKIGSSDYRVKFEMQSGDNLSYPNETFDRVIACHVLEHINNPHLAIKEWIRVIKKGGVLSILIPTDPGLAWRIGRHFGPRKNALAKGISYDYVMAREHVNSCVNLVALLRHYLPKAKESWWPTRIPSTDLNFFFVFHGVVGKE